MVKAVEQLGYDLSDEDKPKVYEAFQAIAAKKDQVSIRELDAIVAAAAMQVALILQKLLLTAKLLSTPAPSAVLKLLRRSLRSWAWKQAKPSR